MTKRTPPQRSGGVRSSSFGRGGDVSALASGAAQALLGRAVGRGLHVVGQVAVARLLGPATFGLFALGWNLLKVVGLVGVFGLDKGVIRYGIEARAAGDRQLGRVLGDTLGLAFVSSAVLGGSLYLAAELLEESVFQKPGLAQVLRWLAVALAAAILARTVAAATRISRRVHYSLVVEEYVQPGVFLVLVGLAFLVTPSLVGPLFAAVISYGLAAVVGIYFLRRLFPVELRPRAGEPLRRLLVFSALSSLGGIFVVLVSRADRLMVGYFMDPASLGQYEAAAQLASILSLILGSFAPIFGPLIAECHRHGRRRRLERLYRVSTKWAVSLALPVFLLLVINPRGVLVTVFDARYEDGWLPLVVLATGQLVNVATGAVGLLLIMTDNHRRWFVLSGAVLAVDLAANWLLIPRLGLLGAALATSVSLTVLFAGGLILARRTLGIQPYDRRMLRVVAAGALAAAGALVVRQVPVPAGAWQLLLQAIVVAGLYLGLYFGLPLDREEKAVIGRLRRRFGGGARA